MNFDTPSVYRQVVAIDGPAASGKSSVARELASKLGFVYVNSGAMYRAVTWYILNRGIDPAATTEVVKAVEEARLDCRLKGNDSRIFIDDVDPVEHLRDVEVNDHVSLVSIVPRVRQILVQKMRQYAIEHDVVMEGRDIGSVVFPQTPYKFYIDASPQIRSQRRAAQGQLDQIAVRDRVDSSRRDSPLMIAPDAHLIDSSNLSIEGVVKEIVGQLEAKGLSVS
ncbi:MAG: (d)CMP kinase [Verrucomicrobiota bacterium]|nr:(d)CMP kinase [Verrucomicrobiota bacterium]